MANANPSVASDARLDRLLGFLGDDPSNTALIADTAAAAYDRGAFDLVLSLIERHAGIAPVPNSLVNLSGMTALAQGRFEDAAATFEALRRQSGDDPGLRFNLAWAKAMNGAYSEALDLLDDDTVAASPRAPALKIHMLHHLERFEEALACGAAMVQQYPKNEELMGALATLAMDAEKPELAARYAERAGKNAEGRAVLGMFALQENATEQSLRLFDEAIAEQPSNPRAWVGKGLGLLAIGEIDRGVEAIDRGAEQFQDHIGSWIASGWAHFVRGDNAGARASFERALSIDPKFAESHGGLAVIDIAEGKLDDAQRRARTAVGLDKNCYGAALARSMLLERGGHSDAAQKVRAQAFAAPVGTGAQTLAQLLAKWTPAARK